MKLKSVEEAYNVLIDIRDNNANPALIDDAIGYLGQALDENEYKYCVIKVHSFDRDIDTVLFINYEEAVDYLEKSWQDYYNTELAEGSDLVEDMTFHEEDYARVTWEGNREYTEFILSAISEPWKFV